MPGHLGILPLFTSFCRTFFPLRHLQDFEILSGDLDPVHEILLWRSLNDMTPLAESPRSRSNPSSARTP